MTLREADLRRLGDIAAQAAAAGGEVIGAYRARGVAVETKRGGQSYASQVVTEADRESQVAVLDILRSTLEQFDLGLLAEESTDDRSRFEKDYFWCVDPLDGTLSFIEGHAGYSVSVALVSKTGTPMIGAVLDPATDVLYTAIKGQGAFRNGEPFHRDLGVQRTAGPLKLFADRSLKTDPRYEPLLAQLIEVARTRDLDGLEPIFGQGAVLNACSVAAEAPACYFKLPNPKPSGGSLWDFSASACILAEWGGVVSDIFGAPLDLNRADDTFMSHRGVLYASDVDLAKQILAIAERRDLITRVKSPSA